jgi:hypothetical protein
MPNSLISNNVGISNNITIGSNAGNIGFSNLNSTASFVDIEIKGHIKSKQINNLEVKVLFNSLIYKCTSCNTDNTIDGGICINCEKILLNREARLSLNDLKVLVFKNIDNLEPHIITQMLQFKEFDLKTIKNLYNEILYSQVKKL